MKLEEEEEYGISTLSVFMFNFRDRISQISKEDEKPRMWETVFDGDESELPHQDFVFNEPKKTSEFDFPKETDEVFEKPAEIQRIKVTKNCE